MSLYVYVDGWMDVGRHVSMYICMHGWMCHKGVVSQTVSSIVRAQVASPQCISKQKKTNDEAVL